MSLMVDMPALLSSPPDRQGRRSMGMPHIVDHGAGEAMALTRMPLGRDRPRDENWLQALLFAHPGLIPVADIEPGFGRLVPAARELACGHGFVDLVYLTGSGDIILVETKLWANPQARREVVAQALDYAAAIGGMTYETFEQRVIAPSKAHSLHALVASQPDALDEAAFIDAVSANLAAGRFLVIVAGEGIRRETESLFGLLQRHAGARFTFALVELGLYDLAGQTLVIPSTLMKTTLIERGVVRIEQGRAVIVPPGEPLVSRRGSGGTSLTEEAFMASMAAIAAPLPGQLHDLLQRLEPLGVYADYRASLNLKVEVEGAARPVNLGYIQKNGALKTDAVGWFAPADLARRYVETLADLVGGEVVAGNQWSSVSAARDGKPLQVTDLLPHHLDAWASAIADFVHALGQQARGMPA